MGENPAYDLIANRHGPAQLGEPGPDDAALDKMIAAAIRAPDHGALRPWRFIALRGAAREKFGEILADSLRRRAPAVSSDDLARERKKALRAPLVVIAAAHIQDHPKIPAVEQLLSAGAAAQNILLASQALGYGAWWRTGEAAYDENVREALGLAPKDAIVGILYIGSVVQPAAQPAPPLKTSDFVERWPEA